MNLILTFIYRRIAHRPNLVKIVDNIGWLFGAIADLRPDDTLARAIVV